MSQFRRLLQRLLATRAGRRVEAGLARRELRAIHTSDPTLRAVLGALGAPAEGEEAASARIEARRAALEASAETVSFETDDPAFFTKIAARSSDPRRPAVAGRVVTRYVAEVTGTTSTDPAWGRCFLRVTRAVGATRCLELGTSVGMSGAYIAAGLQPGGRLVTIDSSAPVVAIARATFADTGVGDRVEVVVGRFDERLGQVLDDLGPVDLAFIDGHHRYEPTLRYFGRIAASAAPGALLVFDDIAPWHHGMEDAWRDVLAAPRVTGSLRMGPIGFAVLGGAPGGHHRVRRLVLQDRSPLAPGAGAT